MKEIVKDAYYRFMQNPMQATMTIITVILVSGLVVKEVFHG